MRRNARGMRLGVGVFLVLASMLPGPQALAARKRAGSPVSVVRFIKGGAGWRLMVDGEPFWIKGVGCNAERGPKGEDYLLMAKEMGANAVRTWGFVPRSYLDRAHRYGLKVCLGIWIEPIRNWSKDSYRDPAVRNKIKAQVLAYVRKVRNHPALMLWGAGNEVFAFTEDEEEWPAIGSLLRELLHIIHLEDPDHPVIYASKGETELSFLKTYLPTLDGVGVNTYSRVLASFNWFRENDYDKPVLFTEFGPVGAWDRPKDENGVPWDPLDHIKAGNYVSLWKQIESMPERCLGGFAFVLGTMRNQDSLTWFNINYEGLRREAYWALYELWTRNPPPNRPPRIREFRLDRASGIYPLERLAVEVEVVDPDGDALGFDYCVTDIFTDPLVVHRPKYHPCSPRPAAPGRATVRVPRKPGIYRVHALVTDGKGNAAVANQSIRVVGR